MKKHFFFPAFVCCMLNTTAQKVTDTAFVRSLVHASEESRNQIENLGKEVAALKLQIQKQQRLGYDRFINMAMFLDVAISSANNLQSLITKESYRNKIVSLNNPAGNELGFNLEMEIQNSLKPLLQKVKKTNKDKFGQVVNSFLNTGKKGLSLFPAGNVFTSIVGMVGNLTVQEKNIDQDDLEKFVQSIEKYFVQYEKLYESSRVFNIEMEKLKVRTKLLQDDIRLLLQDLIAAANSSIKRQQLKGLSTEELTISYFNPKIIPEQLSKPASSPARFPEDAVKSAKEIANNIQRIYDDYAVIYNNNFKEIKNIITDARNVSPMVDQVQLNKTIKELEALFSESRTADSDNLRLKTLFDRLELVMQ
jgi:hypothetical protein